MAFLKLILGSFIMTAVFKVISSQQCTCHQHRLENQLGAMSQSTTEFLCKDLASAIQNVVLAKMRRNSANGLSGPSILSPSGTTGPLVGANLGANVNEVSNPGTCPICARKWQNALARVLGMTGTGQGQNSALPVSATSPVNVPLPYNAVQSHNYGTPAPRNMNVPNAYPSSEIVASNFAANNIANNFGANNFATNNAVANNFAANSFGPNNFAASNAVANNVVANNPSANNLAALLSRSMQNNANVFPEVLMMNGLRN